MKDFSSFDLKIELKSIYNKYYNFNTANTDIEKVEDGIIIKNNNRDIFKILFDTSEYENEITTIKYYDDYYIVGEDFIVCALYDTYSLLKDINTIRLKRGITGTIKKLGEETGLITTILSNIVKTNISEEFQCEDELQEIRLSDIVEDKVVILEIVNIDKLIENGKVNDTLIHELIYSVLINLLNSKGISLEYRKHLYMDSFDNNIIMDIKDNEELIMSKLNNIECMHYFISAENLKVPHFKYVEYYHILEYHFLKTSINKTKELIKKAVTIEFLNGEMEDSEYYELFERMFKHYLSNDDNKEEYQLKNVIINDLGFDTIIEVINRLNIDLKKLFSKALFDDQNTTINTKGILENGNRKIKKEINEQMKKEFLEDLCRRIYKTRNYCVHTKKSENYKILIPTKDNLDELVNDVKIIRAISLAIIKLLD